MKYICFGYLDVQSWSKKSQKEQEAAMDACFDYDENVLRKKGHWAGGEGLKGPDSAVTIRPQNGKVSVTDGPYAESKELLGGLLILEARDLNEAIQLISNHPGSQMGPWEIRPAEDMTEVVRASEERRRQKAGAR